MGEGWGEGAKQVITELQYIIAPPPLNPLPPGEGKLTFYDLIIIM